MQKEYRLESKTLNLTYTLLKKTGLKNVNIRIKPFKGLIVSAPFLISLKEVERILQVKKEWILKSINKIDSKAELQSLFKPGIPFQTFNHELVFLESNRKYIFISISDTKIKVNYPLETNFDDINVQLIIRKAIEKTYISEANPILRKRIIQLAELHQFKFQEIRVKSLKSSWGNCSHKNVITLNSHLIRMPLHLIDYVILHELCHTIEKNHGKYFWLLLQKVTNNKAYELRKEIRTFSPKIF